MSRKEVCTVTSRLPSELIILQLLRILWALAKASHRTNFDRQRSSLTRQQYPKRQRLRVQNKALGARKHTRRHRVREGRLGAASQELVVDERIHCMEEAKVERVPRWSPWLRNMLGVGIGALMGNS